METDKADNDKGKAPVVDDAEEKTQKSSTTPMPGSDDDKWKLYAYRPRFGPFELHEGVVDRFVVAGGGKNGFMSIPLPA